MSEARLRLVFERPLGLLGGIRGWTEDGKGWIRLILYVSEQLDVRRSSGLLSIKTHRTTVESILMNMLLVYFQNEEFLSMEGHSRELSVTEDKANTSLVSSEIAPDEFIQVKMREEGILKIDEQQDRVEMIVENSVALSICRILLRRLSE